MKNDEFITVMPFQDGRRKGFRIEYRFRYVSSPDGDRVAVYIPAYDMHFSAPAGDSEAIRRRATNMVKSFYRYWIGVVNPKEFFLRIHLLGFRADNHNYTLKRLLNKELLNTKFSSNPVVPEVFRGLPISAPTEDVYETA